MTSAAPASRAIHQAFRTPRTLITAGPTHEPIDAVRYIGNRSSGRMGLALAHAAAARGWPTTLLLGPTELQPPKGSHLRVHRFQTAAELQNLLQQHWPAHDLLLMAAAVADYRPAAKSAQGKLKRGDRRLSLEMEPTPDLVAELAGITRPGQTVVGFALEPQETMVESAKRKLRQKSLHAIVANPLQTPGATDVTASLLFADGRIIASPAGAAKTEFAVWLLSQIEGLLQPA